MDRGKVEIRTRKKFLAVGQACVTRAWPTPDFKGEHVYVSDLGSQQKAPVLTSATAVPHCGVLGRVGWKIYKQKNMPSNTINSYLRWH